MNDTGPKSSISVKTPVIVTACLFVAFFVFLSTNYVDLSANTRALVLSSFVGALTVTWVIFGANIASKQLSLHIENQGVSTFLKLLNQTNFSLSGIEKSIIHSFSEITNSEGKIEINSTLHDKLLVQCSEDMTESREKYLQQYVEIYLLGYNSADYLLSKKSLKAIFYNQRHEVFLNESFKAVLKDLVKVREKS